APTAEELPVLRDPRPLRRLQGRPHAGPLHHRPRQDPPEPAERHVCAAPAPALDRREARPPSRADPLHPRLPGV
ncbi:MAG: SSU ribosomal protein S18p @ SSU ribosomal protein S18p, zinc-independent, partial [uncultured Gemmatimonadaceae bacterium]